jgi:hypothetical protein
MRILLIGMVVFLLGSCSKEDLTLQTQINGKWKWEKSCGGIAGITYLPLPGELTTLEFFSNGMFEVRKNGIKERNGRFHIEKINSQYSNEDEYAVIYDNKQIEQIIRSQVDELILLDNVNDGFTHFYTRLK